MNLSFLFHYTILLIIVIIQRTVAQVELTIDEASEMLLIHLVAHVILRSIGKI